MKEEANLPTDKDTLRNIKFMQTKKKHESTYTQTKLLFLEKANYI